MGIVLLARQPVIELRREQLTNIWVSNQGPDWSHDLQYGNLDLSILLADKLSRNWKGCIELCMAVSDADEEAQARQFLEQRIVLARLTGETGVLVLRGVFEEALQRAHLPPDRGD